MIISLVLILATFLYCNNKKTKIEIEKNRLGFMKLNISIEETDKIIDELINSCMDDYLAYNPQIMSEVYINSNLEKEIVEGVTTLCTERISKILFDKISLCYDTNAVASIISRKVYLRVVIFEIEHESQKRQEIEKSTPPPNQEERNPEPF